jgi:phosphatidylserine/phosphatidylglycerophosphate/cardiolipin synthase-like enzyme
METIIGNEFVPKVVPLINNAKKSIDVIVFEWRNYYTDLGSAVFKFNQSFFQAKKRGVNIRVIISAKNYRQKWLVEHFKVKQLYTKKLVHSKIIIIDEETLVVGSHNYTFSGLELNQEISVIIKDKKEIKRLLSFFNNLYK